MMGNEESLTNLGNYINSAKALGIISAILISVVVAFVTGTVIQYFMLRFLFTFNYKKNIKYVGSIWGGIALTAITYFIVMKGVQGSSMLSGSVMTYIKEHTFLFVL